MIYDRTQADVDAALAIRENKIKTFTTLTEAEITQLERGFITVSTLNRIENNQTDLKGLLDNAGYYTKPISNTAWDSSGLFTITDFRRILRNLDTLREAFYTYYDTPSTPAPRYHYQTVNDIEKILADFRSILADIKSHYRECGSFECGEENEN